EIRVPFVDSELLKAFAPAVATLAPGQGKAALAQAASLPLPEEIVSRAKTGFGVPMASWMANGLGKAMMSSWSPESKCVVITGWLHFVLPIVIAANEDARIQA